MKISEAIQKAQENGLVPREITLGESWTAQVLLMPEFWQSLGKAIGWEVVAENGYNEEKLIRSYRGYSKGYGEKMWKSALKKEAWNYQWHRFIDKLADGGTAEQFFEEL